MSSFVATVAELALKTSYVDFITKLLGHRATMAHSGSAA